MFHNLCGPSASAVPDRLVAEHEAVRDAENAALLPLIKAGRGYGQAQQRGQPVFAPPVLVQRNARVRGLPSVRGGKAAQIAPLHGNVLDGARAPIQGVTAALYRKDAWVQRLGYACTDANGCFVLPVEEASKTDTGSLSINVLRSEKVIYIDPNPVEIQPGHVEYRELVIDRTPDVCPPPVGKSETPPPRATTASSGGSEEPAPKPKKGSTRK
jgi:hypothetical protein